METTTVNSIKVGVKAKSKSKIYRALTINGGLYLMPQKEWVMAFISDICFGKIKVSSAFVFSFYSMLQCLFSNDVKALSIPHVGGLRSENILDFIVRVLKEEEYLSSNYIEYH